MHSDASTMDSQPKPPPVADPIPPAGHRSFDIDGELGGFLGRARTHPPRPRSLAQGADEGPHETSWVGGWGIPLALRTCDIGGLQGPLTGGGAGRVPMRRGSTRPCPPVGVRSPTWRFGPAWRTRRGRRPPCASPSGSGRGGWRACWSRRSPAAAPGARLRQRDTGHSSRCSIPSSSSSASGGEPGAVKAVRRDHAAGEPVSSHGRRSGASDRDRSIAAKRFPDPGRRGAARRQQAR
jgi:hypothetical protein